MAMRTAPHLTPSPLEDARISLQASRPPRAPATMPSAPIEPFSTKAAPNSGPKTAQAFWSKGADGRQNSYFCPEGNALAYRYGNSTRNDLIGPGYGKLDFQIAKTFAINETMGVEFKFESFNFTNHPQWNPPSTSFAGTNYGVITSARAMRTNQFALKFNF